MIFSSGIRPWIDAASGAFIPADIAQDAAAARLFVAGENPYGPVIREMHSRVVGLPVAETFPYFPHPPFSLIVSSPLAYVPYRTVAVLWFGFTLALVFILAMLLAENLTVNPGAAQVDPQGRLVLTCFILLLAWPPVLYNLEKGQWSVLLAVLIGLGWRSMSRGSLGASGAWFGAAASVKVFPLVLGGYLLLRSRRALLWFLGIGLVLTGVPLVLIGVSAFADFVGQSRLNMPYWETFPSVTLSIHGALARLLIGGHWAHPATHAPIFARVIEGTVVLLLLGLAVRLTRHAARGQADHAEAFAAWVVMLPVLNPQSLGHNGVLLALPLVLVGRTLTRDVHWRRKAAWAVALVLVSIPRQTMWRVAPPPLDPWEGLAVTALPMWGALLLFLLAVTIHRPAANAASASRTGGVW
ncbi:MAG: DUF2029 domain-containing protein [Acidobacteria bacterium]|nr:DUF2029 domain-containing protein [Acidobacteriota bacterium]